MKSPRAMFCSRRVQLSAAAVITLSLSASWIGNAASPAGASKSHTSYTTVNYVLEWVPNPDFTGLYYGIQHGFFAKQGLKVNLSVNDTGAVPELVGTNKDDLGNGTVTGGVAAKISNIPVEGVAEFMSGATSALIISGKSGVKTLKGLEGKTLGYYNVTSLKTFDYLMTKNGLNPSTVNTISVGDSIVPALVSGKVDAIMGGLTNVEAIQIQQTMGVKPVVFTLPSEGEPAAPQFTILANTDRLNSSASYRSMVKKFITAYVQGEKAAETNVSSAVKIMTNVTSYSPSFLKLSVPVTLKALKPTGGKSWACFNLPEEQRSINWNASQGITTGTVNAKNIFTNKYIPWSC